MSEELSVDEQGAFDLLYKIQSVVKGATFTATRPGVPDGFVTDPYSGEQWAKYKPGGDCVYRFEFPGVLLVQSPNIVLVLALVNFARGAFLEVKHD